MCVINLLKITARKIFTNLIWENEIIITMRTGLSIYAQCLRHSPYKNLIELFMNNKIPSHTKKKQTKTSHCHKPRQHKVFFYLVGYPKL